MLRETLKFFWFFSRISYRRSLTIGIAGLLSGLFGAGLIALINIILHSEGSPHGFIASFVGLVVGIIACNLLSQALLNRAGQDAVLELCLDLSKKLFHASYQLLEEKGQSRILATLTDDIRAIASAIAIIPLLLMNTAILLGCSAYLAYLSWEVFLIVLFIVSGASLVHHYLNTRAFLYVQRAREARETVLRLLRHLVEGLKELHLRQSSRQALLEANLEPAAEDFKQENIAAGIQYGLMQAWTQLMFYGTIGALLFSIPLIKDIPAETLTGYLFAFFYMMGPFRAFIGAAPTLSQGEIALRKIHELGLSLLPEHTQHSITAHIPHPATWQNLKLEGVTFRYLPASQSDESFTLGPLNFSIVPGEIVLIAGGNGSGKTTFVKILCGLYAPHEGQILLNDIPITQDKKKWFREHLAVVFSDFHLFENLAGMLASQLESQVNQFQKELHLDKKVALTNGVYRFNGLSHGQRRRLALLLAFIDDRPIYLFDEWAADQDPYFKDFFYYKFLPELKNRGKSAIVITHDDRYFQVGDRIMKMENGQLIASPEQ
ncbi:MAG: cyclic peptide export ABC transporter [Nitrospira sp.]|nr:cyclic peptide export ABC transporter [Nitrospira sp.]